MHTKAFPYIGILSLFWGTNIVASRFAVGQYNPFMFIFLRLTIASVFFVPFMYFKGRRFPTDRRTWTFALISTVLGIVIPMSGFILSLQHLSSGVASIMVTTSPAVIVVAAHLFLPDERMTRNKALGVILALCGSLIIAASGESGLADVGRANPIGFLFVIMGVSSEGINAVIIRRKMRDMDPIQITTIRLTMGAVFLFFIVLLIGDFSLARVTPVGYFSLAVAALLGALGGQFVAYFVMRNFGATAFSLTSYVTPLVATSLGVVLLDEVVTWVMLGGVAFIASGIYMINKRKETG